MLCPNGQGLYYDEERHYSLPAYLGKTVSLKLEIENLVLSLRNTVCSSQTSMSVLCLLRKSVKRAAVITRSRVTSATASKASTMTATSSCALVIALSSTQVREMWRFINVSVIFSRRERMPRRVSVRQRPLRQHGRLLLLPLQPTLDPGHQQEEVCDGDGVRWGDCTKPTQTAKTAGGKILIPVVCAAQAWISAMTQKFVRMASAWKRRTRTTVVAHYPWYWPLTGTAVWLQRSRLVSAERLGRGCEGLS